ncbi:MAG: hypothetical protein D6706_10630 [Chloroflexi bacterium]|nr:MAG: hypothetical protein D6706_10630 [Chloroflexota bacterium]
MTTLAGIHDTTVTLAAESDVNVLLSASVDFAVVATGRPMGLLLALTETLSVSSLLPLSLQCEVEKFAPRGSAFGLLLAITRE